MFSGIIERLGTVRATRPDGLGALRIDLDTGFADLELGESVAVNGVCLTVTEFDAAGRASFFVSEETLARSNLGALGDGITVNLERAVTLATRLSGHMVQGHVDATGRLVAASESAEAHLLVVALPGTCRRYCVEKGSIALNGISLTINAVDDGPFDGSDADEVRLSLTIIPHTWAHTNLAHIALGGAINVEIDMVAKHIARLVDVAGVPAA